MKKYIIFLFFVIILSSYVYAQEIKVNRETQTMANVNDIVSVKINILNTDDDERTFSIEEKLPDEITMITPAQPHETRLFNGIEASFLKWDVTINSGGVSSLEYKIKLDKPGDYSLSPTKISDTKTGLVVYGNPSNIVVSCLANGVCDEGETYLNCNEDCREDADDGVCNPAPGLCDPDCEGGDKCGKGEGGFSLWYILIPLILIGIIYLIYRIGGKKESDISTEKVSTENVE